MEARASGKSRHSFRNTSSYSRVCINDLMPCALSRSVYALLTCLTERLNSEFRAEAFNVSNTPPLGLPNAVAGNAAFGSITTAHDPRVFELVVKLKS